MSEPADTVGKRSLATRIEVAVRMIRSRFACWYFVLFAYFLSGCAPHSRHDGATGTSAKTPADREISFTDVTDHAHLHFRHVNGTTGKFYYPETIGAGCGVIDYDRDGWPDIILVNGDFWPGQTVPGGKHPTLALFHNNRDGTFTDVTQQARLGISLYGMGVAVGDYDNDGYEDLYITGFLRSILLHNERNGTFRDVTQEAGVSNEGRWGTSAAWLDYDNDGRLDLFVCNYVHWRAEEDQICRQGDIRVYCGPLVYQAESCRLYHNEGNGKFKDVSHSAGIDKATGKSLGAAVWDLDGDRYPDILVANDYTPNYLFRNNRDGTFREVALEASVAYNADGVARSGMGIDVADTQNDGKCQVFISNFAREPNSFFCEEDKFKFTDKTYETGMGEPSLVTLGFGLFFFDFDNDGWQDAFVVNGHVEPQVARYEPGQAYAQQPLLFRNRRDGTFEEIHKRAGPAMALELVGRGAACGDFNNDGKPDILLTSNNGPAILLQNDGGRDGGWLNIRLVGNKSNRDGIGAEVRVQVGRRTLRDQMRSGSSYCSASDLRLHFGLGDARQADSIEVKWPSGIVDRLKATRANQNLVIEEGAAAR